VPKYKNRPPMAGDTPVWHYTSLDAVISMLSTGRLRLTRVDQFDDPFEGSVPKQDIDNLVAIISGGQTALMMMGVYPHHFPGMSTPPRQRYLDRFQMMTERRRAKIRAAHAVCWAAGDESEAMWRLYCNDGRGGQGVALRTTLARLEASCAFLDVYVSPVQYRYYHVGSAFDDEMDALLHKRKAFEYEHEVRVLHYDHDQYLKLIAERPDGAPPPPDLANHLSLDWSLTDTIEEIAISPYADDAYECEVRRRVVARSRSLESLIGLSVLSERRYPANF